MESRLLDLASARGLLDRASAEDLDPASLLDPDALGRSSRFGPRLDRLVRQGLLDHEALEELAWEVVLGGASPLRGGGSWVDEASPLDLPDLEQAPDPGFQGRFTGFRLLGEGATARVYKAFDPQLERWVALKFLRTTHPGRREALLDEARAQARVDHPNVCKVHEVGRLGEHGYILMELARGATLAEALPALGLEAKVRLLRDLAEGVHAAHRQSLVHLDLKPGNVLLQPKEGGGHHPLLADFGMMRPEDGARGPACPMGTPPYSSPEQLRGDARAVDRRSDLHGLGVLLYVALCGRFPHDAASLPELVEATLERPPVPLRKRDPRLPEDLEAIAGKCMAKDPQDRYGSALELAEDLQRFLDGRPVLARPMGPWGRGRHWARRNRALAAAALGGLVALGALGAWGLRTRHRARVQAEAAERFGREAERLESRLRHARMLPRRSVQPAVDETRAGMAALEGEMRRIGPLAEGPGHLALGRTWLYLGDPARARTHLEAAWKAGEQGAEAAQALGTALAQVYTESRRGVLAKERPGPARDAHLEALEAELGRPAVAYLERGAAGGGPGGALAGALAQTLRGRTEAGLQGLREAFARVPWMYEAKLLEADQLLLQAAEASRLDRHAEVLARTEAAEAALQSLVQVAGSDVRAYLRLGEVASERYWTGLQGGDPRALGPAMDAMTQAADRALEVEPENPEAWRAAGTAACQRARHLVEYVPGPEPEARKVLDEGRRRLEGCLARDPGDGRAHTFLGRLFTIEAIGALRWGRDPRPLVAGAGEAFRAAQRLRPQDADDNLSGLNRAYLNLAEWERSSGLDPRESFRRAREAITELLALQPQDAYTQRDAATVRIAEAEYRFEDEGEDPSALLEEARRTLGSGDPAAAASELNVLRGWAATGQAAVLQAAGRDGSAAWAEGMRDLEETYRKRRISGDLETLLRQGLAWTETRVQEGRDAEPELGRLRRRLAEYGASAGVGAEDVAPFRVRVEALAAWSLLLDGKPARGPALAAEAALRSEQGGPSPSAPGLVQAARCRLVAALAVGGEGRWKAYGEALGRLRSTFPGYFPGIRLEAEGALLEARRAGTPASRTRLEAALKALGAREAKGLLPWDRALLAALEMRAGRPKAEAGLRFREAFRSRPAIRSRFPEAGD